MNRLDGTPTMTLSDHISKLAIRRLSFMKPARSILVSALLLLPSAVLHAAAQSGSLEVKVKTLVVDPVSRAPVVVLETVADKRLVPIWIDIPEARAIALELEQVAVPRPLTHDLMRNILQGLGATLRDATITDIRNSTYFAVLSLHFQGREVTIDARPSDAVALALRMKAPIYASAQVLAKSKSMPALGTANPEAQKKLGIVAQDLTPEIAALLDVQASSGVLIADVAQSSPAMMAGMARGDVITRADDQPIHSAADLEAFIKSKKEGRVSFAVIRKGKPTILEIDLRS
jgi:hypothetical protein